MDLLIQYASDLHLENKKNQIWLETNPLQPVAPYLILAGDIMQLDQEYEKESFWDYIAEHWKQTYVLPGNHEFYGHTVDLNHSLDLKIDIRPTIQLVNNQSIDIKGNTFLFTTLWSHITNHKTQKDFYDFRRCTYKGELFNFRHYNALHKQCLDWLTKAVEQKKH